MIVMAIAKQLFPILLGNVDFRSYVTAHLPQGLDPLALFFSDERRAVTTQKLRRVCAELLREDVQAQRIAAIMLAAFVDPPSTEAQPEAQRPEETPVRGEEIAMEAEPLCSWARADSDSEEPPAVAAPVRSSARASKKRVAGDRTKSTKRDTTRVTKKKKSSVTPEESIKAVMNSPFSLSHPSHFLTTREIAFPWITDSSFASKDVGIALANASRSEELRGWAKKNWKLCTSDCQLCVHTAQSGFTDADPRHSLSSNCSKRLIVAHVCNTLHAKYGRRAPSYSEVYAHALKTNFFSEETKTTIANVGSIYETIAKQCGSVE